MTLKRKVSNNSVLVVVNSSAYKIDINFSQDSLLQYKVITLCNDSNHDYSNSNSCLILILLTACFVHVVI